jgi:ABC-type uncharacterized transport system permease subunit
MAAADVFLWAATALYGVAGALYTLFLVGVPARAAGAARATLALAFVAHMATIGARGVVGSHPVSTAGDATGFLAWIMVGAFLAAEWRRRLDAVGAFVAPVALVLVLVAYRSARGDAGGITGLGVLGRVHIVLAVVGASAFTLAAGLAVFYLLEERQLKRKHVGKLVKRGAALDTLDRYANRAVLVGFPVFSVAMVTGAIWQSRRAGGLRLEYPIAILAWGAFAALLVARYTAGWRGRRAAVLTLLGFGATLAVLGLYMARRMAEG